MTSFPTAFGSVGDLVEIRRETTRSTLALLIITLLSALAAFIVVYTLTHHGDPKEIISGVFAPVIGIAGTVLGFYFGSQDTR